MLDHLYPLPPLGLPAMQLKCVLTTRLRGRNSATTRRVTPSTITQRVQRADEYVLAPLPPGCRVLDLKDTGEIGTHPAMRAATSGGSTPVAGSPKTFGA